MHLVCKIEGCYTHVMGLPVNLLKNVILFKLKMFFACLCLLGCVHAGEVSVENVSLSAAEKKTNKLHILYLVQAQELEKAFTLYQDYKRELGKHDFEVLQQIGLILLEQGARSSDPQKQLTSIFGSSLAGVAASIDILEAGIMSAHPQTQMAAIQFLGHLQDDRCEELFTKAMSSDYFFTRMEAAYQLSARKSRTAIGQIESLMHKVPPQMRFFFPQFFALIGTSDAITLLRHLMDEPFHITRVEAILNAARFGRDDLLPSIRCKATHLNSAEQEACAYALGLLKDSKSLPLLRNLSKSPSVHVKLASLLALYSLGEESVKEEINALAKQDNLFALGLLGGIPGSEAILLPCLTSDDIQVRFNGVIALLKLKSSAVYPPLLEFIIRDSKDLGFQPQFSTGNSLMAWKVIPSAKQHQKTEQQDLAALALNVREHLLHEALELPVPIFLKIASAIFASKQTDLVPQLVYWIENLQTEEAIQLLKEQVNATGAPLTRAYCALALFRLTKADVYKTALLQWVAAKKQTEMIRFRPSMPWDVRISDKLSSFELTPEENSKLLIECYQTLALEHAEGSIDILLDSLITGHPSNRPLMAGLLIQAIQ
jgi:HEAT repeat protein